MEIGVWSDHKVQTMWERVTKYGDELHREICESLDNTGGHLLGMKMITSESKRCK